MSKAGTNARAGVSSERAKQRSHTAQKQVGRSAEQPARTERRQETSRAPRKKNALGRSADDGRELGDHAQLVRDLDAVCGTGRQKERGTHKNMGTGSVKHSLSSRHARTATRSSAPATRSTRGTQSRYKRKHATRKQSTLTKELEDGVGDRVVREQEQPRQRAASNKWKRQSAMHKFSEGRQSIARIRVSRQLS